MPRSDGPGSTRERILAVALELFARHGYEGTSIRDIADRMEMTKAAVYYHFPSKDSLLVDLLKPTMAEVGKVLRAHAQSGTPDDRRALVTALVDVVGAVGPRVVVMFSDPAVGMRLRTLSNESPLPQRVASALLGPLPDDPDEAAAHRMKGACAVACLPAGIEAWRRTNPDATGLDDPAKEVLVELVLAVVERPVGTGSASNGLQCP